MKKNTEDRKILSNRQKARLPKREGSWCSCDCHNLKYGQCPRCGDKAGEGKDKPGEHRKVT